MSDTIEAPAKSKSKTSKAAAAETTNPRKGSPRPSAILNEIDFSGVDVSALEQAAARRSPWDDVLEKLYDATEQGLVGRDENGALKYVNIGNYASAQSAKAQIKAFTERKLTETYEFMVAGKGLFARVIES